MSQLILDTSDPAVAEMISGWQEGGKYRIELTATQGKASGSLVAFEVNEITDYGDPEEPVEAEVYQEEGDGGVAGEESTVKKIRTAQGAGKAGG